MSQAIERFSPHESGSFLSTETGDGGVPYDDRLPAVALSERGIKTLRMEDMKGRTHNGRVPLVGTVTCYIAAVNGSSYYVQRAEPLVSTGDAVGTINKTPAFITTDDKGINEIMTAICVDAGFNVNVISQEAGWQRCPSLAQTALNHIAISDALRRDALLDDKLSPLLSDIEDEEGVSRGSKIVEGKMAIKERLGRATGNIEQISPVYHHGNSVRKDIVLYAGLVREAKGFAKIAFRYPGMVRVLKDTVITSPWEIVHAARSISSLRSSYGAELIRQINPEQRGTVSIAGLDSFGQSEELREEYSRFPNIDVRYLEGAYHISFSDPQEMLLYQQRTQARADALRYAAKAA